MLGVFERIGEGLECIAMGLDAVRREVSYGASNIATDIRTKTKCWEIDHRGPATATLGDKDVATEVDFKEMESNFSKIQTIVTSDELVKMPPDKVAEIKNGITVMNTLMELFINANKEIAPERAVQETQTVSEIQTQQTEELAQEQTVHPNAEASLQEKEDEAVDKNMEEDKACLLIVKEWDVIIQKLKVETGISEISFKTWINPLEVGSVTESTINILCPLASSVDYITQNYLVPFQTCIAEVTGKKYDIKFIVRNDTSFLKKQKKDSANG